MKTSKTIHNLEELDLCAQDIVAIARETSRDNQSTVVTLSGDLGAGKTTLAQHLAQALGVTEEVSSPTFVIAKYYDLTDQSWRRLVHIDAYRLEGEPLEPLGFTELFADADNLVVIEWPEYIKSVLPQQCTDVAIAINPDESRTITIAQQD